MTPMVAEQNMQDTQILLGEEELNDDMRKRKFKELEKRFNEFNGIKDSCGDQLATRTPGSMVTPT